MSILEDLENLILQNEGAIMEVGACFFLQEAERAEEFFINLKWEEEYLWQ